MKAKSTKFVFTVFAMVVMALCLCFSMRSNPHLALAETKASTFFFDQLNTDAKKVYNAIDEMESSGKLKTGNTDYDLVSNGVFTSEQISALGQTGLLMAFGAGRDAWYFDHPNVFYLDSSYLSVRGGTKDGKAYAYIGTGRGKSYYIDSTLSTEKISQMSADYETKIAPIVATASAKETVKEKVQAVNDQIAEIVDYSFEFDNDTTSPYIRTSYGALVNGKAVCEGYSRLFKDVCDRLNIPCVLVYGVAVVENADVNDGAGYEQHMWNYVNIDGAWYAVDVTWNDDDHTPNQYLMVGNSTFRKEHIPQGVVSEANYEFSYPTLAEYQIGVSATTNGLIVTQDIVPNSDDQFTRYKISFNGMGAKKVKEEFGLNIVYKFIANDTKNEDNPDRTPWVSPWTTLNGLQIYSGENAVIDEGDYTIIKAYININNIQFGITYDEPNDNGTSGMSPTSKDHPNYVYDESEKDIDLIDCTSVFENPVHDPDYVSPPHPTRVTPVATTRQSANETHTITILFDEKLELIDKNATYTHQDGSVKNYYVDVFASKASAVSKCTITDVIWNENEAYKFTLKFKASPMFAHDQTYYTFIPKGLIGKESQKVPEPVTFGMAFDTTVYGCLRCGKPMYFEIYGQPTLLATDDLSKTDFMFKDPETGLDRHVNEGLRSQMVLVTSRPNNQRNEEMLDKVEGDQNLTSEDLLTFETFEISLNLCGQYIKIPNGSYMQLALGFPEGYGPDDAGVTFKVYHFTTDDSGKEILSTEELECVVTEYGLIITCYSFSPFAVVALPTEKVTDVKTGVNAMVYGDGSIDVAITPERDPLKTYAKHEGTIALSSTESAKYTFTPNAGSVIEKVILNGLDITDTVSSNANTLTINYDTQKPNQTLCVYYVSSAVVEKESAMGFTPETPKIEVIDKLDTLSASISGEQETEYDEGQSLTITSNVVVNSNLNREHIKYQWFKDGVALEGMTESELQIKNLKTTDAGKYTCEVSLNYQMRSKSVTTNSVSIKVNAVAPARHVSPLLIICIVMAVALVILITIILVEKYAPKRSKKTAKK